MPNKITTPLGLDKTEPFQLRDQNDVIVTTYLGTEPLSAQVWRGGDQPVLFSPTVRWEDVTKGLILVTFLGSATAGLEPGQYQVRILVNNGPIPDSLLELTPSPGNAPPLKAYCTVGDMYDYFSDLGEILDPKDQTGFGRQRAKARAWTDRVIQCNRRNTTSYYQAGLGGPCLYGMWGTTWNGQQADPILQRYLDENFLELTSQVVEMNARMSLAYSCEGEIGPGDKLTQWQMLAARNRAEAEALACKLVAQIDTNGDGYAEIMINCGMATNR